VKAKTAAAYHAAGQYLQQAKAFLTETPWTDTYSLTLKIFNESCEIGYLTGNHDAADKDYDAVLKNARNPFDKVNVLEVKIVMYTGANQPAKAIKLGSDALNMLGLGFPKKSTTFAVIKGLIKIKWLLRNKTADDLIKLPEMTDPKKKAIARILMRCTEPSYVENPTFLIIAVLKLLALTIKYGNSKYSAFAFATYGAMLCGAFGSYTKGRKYAELSLKAIDKFNAAQLNAKVNLLIGGGIHHWTKPLKEDLHYLLVSYKSGVEIGDHSFAAYGVTCYMYTLFFLGEPLKKVDEKFKHFTDPMRKLHQESSMQEFRIWHQLVENLRTDPTDPTQINGSICDAEKTVSQWKQVNELPL
jgi:histidine kinase